MAKKILIETTAKELEKYGLIICKCGHYPNNHFDFQGKRKKPCAHCKCENYNPEILIGKVIK
jgi:hypothetical protein